MQKSIFPQKIQTSLCITKKSLYTNSKFQTQLSRKLQRFRGCRKNNKCSIFHDLSEYIIFSYDCNCWTDPLAMKITNLCWIKDRPFCCTSMVHITMLMNMKI